MFKMMQKKYFFCILCLSFTSNAVISMQKPLARLSRNALHELHLRTQTATAPHMPSKYYSIEKPKPCTNEKLNFAFELLQQRMELHKMIPLFTSPILIKNGTLATFLNAVYNPRPHAIILSEHELNGTTPTAKLALLLSLLRFGQYHQEDEIRIKNKLECNEAKQKSHEFTINTLSECETCLNVLRTTCDANDPLNRKFTYLLKKCRNQNCQAHTQAWKKFDREFPSSNLALESLAFDLQFGALSYPNDERIDKGIFFSTLDKYVPSLKGLIPKKFPK